ncbi:MAG: hypothetical protein HFG74_02895 [Hungatella sp.]|nr:hypothetical protein [Hungatella sp.]
MGCRKHIDIKRILDFSANTIHAIFLCFLCYCIIRAITDIDALPTSQNFWGNVKSILLQMDINEIYTFIGSLGFILFGITGIYDFAYLNGLYILVPPAFVQAKEKTYIKQAEKMMELYYKKDIEFILEYEKERTNVLLQAMGIEEKQFHLINYEIIKARTESEKSIHALKRKAKKLLLHKEYIINQSALSISKKVYDKVDYFFNLYTALYDNQTCESIGKIMLSFLCLSLKEKVETIDYIVIPKGSNFLLGLETAKLLHKPVISVLSEERIFKNAFWDGNYTTDKVNNIVVIHDVLVSGKRIYESIEKLPDHSYNLYGIFCLMKYNSESFTAIDDFLKHNISEDKINCLLDIDENLLKQIYEDRYEYD